MYNAEQVVAPGVWSGNGVCLAIFVAIVLAACETPAPGVAAPQPYRKSFGDISSLAQGTTGNVGLSNAFKGEKLTFSVRSDDLDVAVPTIAADNRSIVIRAIGPGTAAITVTATNSGGSVSQTFTVTVPTPQTSTPPQQPPQIPSEPAPEPTTTKHSDCPSPLEITRGGNRKCTLTEGHALVYSVPAGEQPRVKVSEPDSSATEEVWTITALLKGRPVVHIRDATGTTVDEITVVVPNTTPRLIDPDEEISGTLLNHSDEAGLHTATLTGIAPAFTDDDEVDKSKVDPIGNGIFNYKVTHKPPELLIKTVRGFLLTKNSPKTTHDDIEAVVLKPFTEDFTIEIYAYDPDNGRSDSPVKNPPAKQVALGIRPLKGAILSRCPRPLFLCLLGTSRSALSFPRPSLSYLRSSPCSRICFSSTDVVSVPDSS